MALSIKDGETDELARRLAERTGESLTEAVKTALRERLERERRGGREPGLADRLVQIGRRCAAEMSGPFDSSDHGELLYDERGLPR
jgi:antitoxin VapB